MSTSERRNGAGRARKPRRERPVRILVVDDRPQNLLALSSILEAPGTIVEQASSGRDALRHLLRADFALVLLDVNMPDIDGFETAQLIRARPASAHTPIVFVTAAHDDALVVRSYALGAVDYITSPVNPEILRAKVAVFVDLFRKTEENRLREAQLRRAEERLRRRAEARLRETDELLRRVVESVSDYAIFSLDTQGRIASWNAGAARLFGIEEREALGCDCSMLFPVGSRDARPHWTLAREEGRAEVDAWFLGRAGEPFFGRGIVTAMRGKSGEIVGYSKVVQDVTARRLAEDSLRQKAEQLAEANRMKDEFLAVLSHELRTPLNAIIGWTHLLMRPDLEPTVARQALETIARNGQVQLALINDILDVSRTITGKMRLSLVPVDLVPIVRAAVDTVTMAAGAKGIRLTTVLDDQGPLMVNGDASRLQQVVWNLVANAVKFTSEGGHVRVAARRDGRSALVEVTDDGAGIAPAFLPFVFDRFRQADSSTVRAHGGLGLGLAIVKHLAEAHGGSVAACSEGEGRGATFRLRLPVLSNVLLRSPDASPSPPAIEPTAAAPDPVPVPMAPPAPVRLTGLRCLVVDDDGDARQLMRTVLEKAGAHVTDAATVGEALEQVGHAELVVADIGMPGQDGYAFIRQVRALPADRGGRVPSIALTAYVSEKDRQAALDAGFDEHLTKPLEPNGFFRTVVSLLGGQAASGVAL